ncbi:MAG: hypothetical protein D3924_15535 [Candidatus Electrothrix sp. AR4]|nr:hypothetical protein [Candidatus Electrothrix sp. AR4]
MYSIIREMTSGIGAAVIFIVLWIVLPGESDLLLSFALALGSYFGIRFFFHPGHKKVKVVLPDDISREEFKAYISNCELALSLVRVDIDSVRNPSFKTSLLHLCDLGDDLMTNFEKDPEDIRIAQALPDRLRRLHEMLTAYIDLSDQRSQSPQTIRALEATEKAVTKAVGKFEQLHHRLLENDAIDLSTNAKTFDNLLDFD